MIRAIARVCGPPLSHSRQGWPFVKLPLQSSPPFSPLAMALLICAQMYSHQSNLAFIIATVNKEPHSVKKTHEFVNDGKPVLFIINWTCSLIQIQGVTKHFLFFTHLHLCFTFILMFMTNKCFLSIYICS